MHPTTWKASGHVDNFKGPDDRQQRQQEKIPGDHPIEAHAETLPEADGKSLDRTDGSPAGQIDDYLGLKALIEDTRSPPRHQKNL